LEVLSEALQIDTGSGWSAKFQTTAQPVVVVQFKFDVRLVSDHRDGIERPSTEASKPTEHHALAFGFRGATGMVAREHFKGTVRWR
jgi:hypothetical protein